jgi:hypothetical protein
VGDQFHYQIFVDHSPKVQFILDNVNKDTISSDPLRVVNVTTSTMPLKDGRERLVVELTVASLATGVTGAANPAALALLLPRDGRHDVAHQRSAAAESLTIPGPIVAVRSTLPPKRIGAARRGDRSGWPRSRWIVSGVGWSAVVLLVAGLAWQAVQVVRGRKRRTGPDPRKAMAAVRERWLSRYPTTSPIRRVVMEFYGRSYRDLKEYVGYLLETPTEDCSPTSCRPR